VALSSLRTSLRPKVFKPQSPKVFRSF
jgi:hypothetical protein